jgi:hypothetical protein
MILWFLPGSQEKEQLGVQSIGHQQRQFSREQAAKSKAINERNGNEMKEIMKASEVVKFLPFLLQYFTRDCGSYLHTFPQSKIQTPSMNQVILQQRADINHMTWTDRGKLMMEL